MERVIMGQMAKDELWADWVATQNIVRFQELLKRETDDGRYKILALLLANEFEKFKKSPDP
jgi:hypothetical protein